MPHVVAGKGTEARRTRSLPGLPEIQQRSVSNLDVLTGVDLIPDKRSLLPIAAR